MVDLFIVCQQGFLISDLVAQSDCFLVSFDDFKFTLQDLSMLTNGLFEHFLYSQSIVFQPVFAQAVKRHLTVFLLYADALPERFLLVLLLHLLPDLLLVRVLIREHMNVLETNSAGFVL